LKLCWHIFLKKLLTAFRCLFFDEYNTLLVTIVANFLSSEALHIVGLKAYFYRNQTA